MKKRRRTILAVIGVLIPTVLGICLGFSSGVSINDDARIKKEISRVDLEEPIELKQVARGSDGKVELKVIEEYLERFQEQIFILNECNEELKHSSESGKEIDEVKRETLYKANEAAYQEMQRLAKNPETYVLERIRVYGTEYETWCSDWTEALRVVPCSEEFEGKYTRIYEENKAYLQMGKEK